MEESLKRFVTAGSMLTVGLAALSLTGCSEPGVGIDDILAGYQEDAEYGGLTIDYPLDETLFPPEIVPPTFRWEDGNAASDTWLVTIEFPDD